MLIAEIDDFDQAYWEIENIPFKTSGMVVYILFVARDKTLEILKDMK